MQPSTASSTHHLVATAGGEPSPSNFYKKKQNPNILTVVKEYPNKKPIHGNSTAVGLEHKWERPPRHPNLPAP